MRIIKYYRCLICFMILCLTPFIFVNAQNSSNHKLSIGENLPDLIIKDVINHLSDEIKLSDLKGKVIIFDFWSRGCLSCIKAFPKMEALQDKFKEKIQVLLVTKDSRSEVTKYLKKIKVNLPRLPIITNDTILSALFPYIYVPHHVWIDAAGRVKYITNGYNTTNESVEDILNGKEIDVLQKIDFPRDTILQRPLFSFSEAPSAVVYNSCFTLFSEKLPLVGVVNIIDSVNHTVRNSYLNTSVLSLYQFAFNESNSIYSNDYIHKNKIILSVKDSSLLIRPQDRSKFDEWQKNSTFNYEQIVPLSAKGQMFSYMQEDVNRFFSDLYGISARLEKRKIKCLVLIRTSTKDKLSAKTTKQERSFITEEGHEVQYFKNYPFRNAIGIIRFNMFPDFLSNSTEPFIDETGLFLQRVDLKIKSDLKNINELKKELSKFDLDIIIAEREIQVLVITQKSSVNKSSFSKN